MKWVTKNYRGEEKIWYSAQVINKINELVQETINKRPHSDNTVFYNILQIIKEADSNGQE